jgi:RNA recognition motif-containing protein
LRLFRTTCTFLLLIVCAVIPRTAFSIYVFSHALFSLSAQVILRGTRSAGYGFVALSSAEAAQKAVEQLHQKELDGRTVIVEVAKPADQKEAREKKVKRKQNRRGSKAVPGELTEAEANGAVVPVEGGAAPSADEAAKPKKAKRTKVLDFIARSLLQVSDAMCLSAQAQA